MASCARARNSLAPERVSVLAQAKPVIISPTPDRLVSVPGESAMAANCLGEQLNKSLKLNSTTCNATSASEQGQNSIKFDLEQRAKYIEDESVIQRQNASNQMRQAAVMAAVASQQKVRLSATERLALTAKRPQVQPAVPAKPGPIQMQQAQGQLHAASKQAELQQVNSRPPVKPAPMPTLETLLAVQRQLQQHTKQRLNDTMARPNPSAQQSACLEAKQGSKQQHKHGKPLPPSPPKSDLGQPDTYEKDLPPLPPSISPSTSTDDSQLNSLESHQSSPATSLVSLPPPPPPISSYLQQYDEVNGCHRVSSSSSPSIASTCEISSVKHYPVSNEQQQSSGNVFGQVQAGAGQGKVDSPVPFKNLSRSANHVQGNQAAGISLKHQAAGQTNRTIPGGLACQAADSRATPAGHKPSVQQNELAKSYQSKSCSALGYPRVMSQPPPPPPPLLLPPAPMVQLQAGQKVHHETISAKTIDWPNMAASTMSKLNSSPAFLPPPPPPLSMSDVDESAALDEPDSGNFRFPTPPPAEMLLKEDDCSSGSDLDDARLGCDANTDEQDMSKRRRRRRRSYSGINNTDLDADNEHYDHDDEQQNEDDFQCRIPTPPAHKALPVGSYASAFNQLQKSQLEPLVEQHSMAVFDAASFSTPAMHMGLQPPPSFRQQQQQQSVEQSGGCQQAHLLHGHHEQQQQRQRQHHYRHQSVQQPAVQPQLSVYINNDGGGLLSTAPVNSVGQQSLAVGSNGGQLDQLEHERMMITMATSSSSPSSSSDCDGQSSNSSSSTSGIHSSIDSPSLSGSNDFNYSAKTLVRIAKTSSNKFASKLAPKLEPPARPACMSADMLAAFKLDRPRTSGAALAPPAKPRPALKQKKTVSFSDKVELVACFEEQTEDHLPNPLLARVLAGKLQ